MKVHGIVPILKVTDLEQALEFYCTILGFEKEFEYEAGEGGPYYVSISLGGHGLHLSTFPGDGVLGAKVYCYVDDIDALYEGFLVRGLNAHHMPPTNQTWNMREVYVYDPDGNAVRFGSPIPGESMSDDTSVSN